MRGRGHSDGRRPVRETGPAVALGGGVRVAVCYPNRYFVAMSNLGFLWAHHALNTHGLRCERFTVEKEGLSRSVESGAPLSDFSAVAFSISYELDYPRVVRALVDAGIPPLRRERRRGHLLVLACGVAPSANPAPLEEIVDAFVLGDGEPVVADLAAALGEAGRAARRKALSEIDGVYVPGSSASARRGVARSLDSCETYSHILTPDTEFGDMFLIELLRGCSGGCRFCLAGFISRPPRARSLEGSLELVKTGLRFRNRIGVVGLSAADYPHAEEFCHGVRRLGGTVSFSSVTVDSLTDPIIEAMVESGQRTVAFAPEAGTERLRRVINKPVPDDVIVDRAMTCFSRGITRLRLYFMVGLPTETDEDVHAIAELAGRIQKESAPLLSAGAGDCLLTLSVNPFVPKPSTPFQWVGMAPAAVLRRRIAMLKKATGTLARVNLIHDSVKWSRWQAALARGDERLAEVLVDVAGGADWRAALRARGLREEELIERERDAGETFPWDRISGGVSRRLLRAEYDKAMEGRASVAPARGQGRDK